MRKTIRLIIACCFLFFVLLAQGAKQVNAAFSFTINGELSKVTDKNQEISVPLTVTDLPSGDSYFRVAFQKNTGDSYFGYMKDNSDNWVKITSPLAEGCNKYLLVAGPGDKILTLRLKIGDDNEPENGAYSVVAHRMTSGCSSSGQKSPITIELPIAPTPTPTPSPTPSPTPTQTLVPSPTPTPGPTNTPTSTTTPTPTSADYNNIYINEYIPDPENGNEKVEIKNGNSTTVSLQDWKIDDIESGGHDPLTFSITISSSGLHVVDLLAPTGFLNNDNDSVRLLNSNNTEKDKRDYSSSTKGKSWSRDGDGDWCLQTPSFGSDNADCPASPTNTPTATPTPTKTPTPSPTGKLSPTPSLKITPTPSVEPVLTPVNLVTNQNDSYSNPTVLGTADEALPKKKPPVAAFAIIGGGVVSLSLGAFSFLKGKR